ncbi:MAG: AarF/UbiB family protein, partial [Halobacteria archaeon]|nr:AarF/UbiB family protein [Halobacteria archaeon]
QKFVEEAHAESMQGLADDFERRINQEMDYNRERRMLNEIKSNFEGDRRVVIPGTYDDICSKRVLAMEYHGGIKISEVDKLKRMGFDTEQLAKDLEKIYLQQSLVDGVFHGDPHPGNLAVNE